MVLVGTVAHCTWSYVFPNVSLVTAGGNTMLALSSSANANARNVAVVLHIAH